MCKKYSSIGLTLKKFSTPRVVDFDFLLLGLPIDIVNMYISPQYSRAGEQRITLTTLIGFPHKNNNNQASLYLFLNFVYDIQRILSIK